MNRIHGTLVYKAIHKNQDATFQQYVFHSLPKNHNNYIYIANLLPIIISTKTKMVKKT